MELYLISFAALFSVLNPLGTVPVFVGLAEGFDSKKRIKVALQASVYTLIILTLFFILGTHILSFFGLSIEALRIAGGLVIATSGFALLTGKFSKHKGMKNLKVQEDVDSKDDISLTPIAMPMLAGPGSMSLLIGMYQEQTLLFERFVNWGALFTVCVSIFLLLSSSHLIVKMMGASGINAISRIIGFIVIAIGMEYIIQAIVGIHRLYFA